jgi:hypothetical protein
MHQNLCRKSAEVTGGKLSKEQIQKMGQEEIRRRCLLGRLGGVAESVWMSVKSQYVFFY